MAGPVRLPKANDLGFYEMRFESVGGLGAKPIYQRPDEFFALTGKITNSGLVEVTPASIVQGNDAYPLPGYDIKILKNVREIS